MINELIPGARRLQDRAQQHRTARGFRERLAIAAGARDVVRTLAEPYYLSDLGVREFEDPKTFFDAHAALGQWAGAIDTQEVSATLKYSDVVELADRLDALVLLTGDYATARLGVLDRANEIAQSGDAVLQIYAGVLMASAGDPLCRNFFAAAAQHPHAVTRFTSFHRLAASEVKRFGRPDVAMTILDQAEHTLEETSSVPLSRADRDALRSVAANLRALALLKLGRVGEATKEVSRARELSTMVGLQAVQEAESARYLAQENINVAQVALMQSGNTVALAELEANVAFCERLAAEYVSEATAAFAYGLFLAGHWKEAAATAGRAATLIAQEASPTRLRSVRETHAASLYKAGDEGAAVEVLRLIDDDPLGFETSSLRPAEVKS